ncbi:MAG: hypothetical protein HC880_17710 [Bacteroidia bacterium]|nr:hypothetical protein [Bacteroidia bacterium]
MDIKLIVDILGWIGSAAILLAYGMVSYQRVSAASGFYQGLNIVGSLFLIVNTAYYHAYPSTFVNIVWIIIAVLALLRKRPG